MTDDLERRLASLTPAKRALLLRRLARRPGESPTRASARGLRELSFAQRRQWFLHVLDPGNPVFNISDATRLLGPLDYGALRRALVSLVDRHEILRTGYTDVEGEPKQFVFEDWEYPLPVVDIPARLGWETELNRFIAQERGRPFDLGRDVLHRSTVVRLGAQDHVLVRTTHHMASDRWSAGIVNRDLSVLYGGYATDRTASLPALPFQYADFAAWQRRQYEAGELAAHEAYWTERLAGAPFVLDLPADRNRPAFQSNRGSVYREPLAAPLVEALRSLARREGCTTFMVLFTAFALLAGRFARQDDLLVGIPVAGRNRPELEDLIGQFINTLVLRTDLTGEPSFRDLLAEVRRTTLESLAHQDLPFDRLVETIRPTRLPGRTPLFQVMFDYLSAPTIHLDLPGLRADRLSVEADATAYDLSIYVTEHSGGLQLAFEYALDLFDHSSVSRLAATYRTLLEAAVANPGLPALDLPLLSAGEVKRVLSNGWSATRDLPIDTVVGRFERQAAKHRDAPAIRFEDRTLTYGMLDAAANRLARTLRNQGVLQGTHVAIVLDRSPALVTSVLAIAKAGGVAVLLDPAHPQERLAYQLTDSTAAFVISDRATPGGFRGTTIDPGGGADEIEIEPAEHLSSPATLDDPMYVVYTSGSTGRPKGILVGHRSVANFVDDAIVRYGLGREDRVLQFAGPGFDTMIEELFPGLCTGACIVVRPDGVVSFADVARLVSDESVTVLDLPTAYWSAWVSELTRREQSFPPSVRLTIVGGEAALVDDWIAWRRITAGGVRWVNTYGPSETTVVVAAFEPPAGWPGSGGATVPIGRPIANTFLKVVDNRLQPVPVGVPGELLVGGIALSLGYLGDAGSANERFIEDPEAPGDGRVFRTGDLVRWLPDGSLEFRGRLDTQVKVRGVRVEPGEVEHCLLEHPAVRGAAVVLIETRSGEVTLAAHVEQVGGRLSAGRLSEFLRRRLPEQMIPATFTFHHQLPRTPGGKIDRTALAVFVEPSGATAPVAEPISELQVRLLAIWSEVLDRDDLVVHDNFFDVGGHSLLSIKLMSRVSDAVGRPVPLRLIFEAPTVEALAMALEGDDAGERFGG